METDRRKADAPDESSESMTPLELARHLWETHRPQKEGEEQRMVYDYVPDWLLPHIPKLYSQDGERDPVVWLKFFLPEGRWTFYVTEYSEVAPDETPDLFFGYMASPLGEMYDELGYVTLEQIEEIRGPHLGSRIERDLWWTPKRLSEVKAALNPPPSSRNQKARVTQTSEAKDITARVEEIKAREGAPCSVVVNDGEIVHVITPAWLYWQWHTLLGEHDEIDDTKADSIARSMFLEGGQAFSGSASDFRRYCRCVIQGALLNQEPPVWEETYRAGGDFIPSPSWQNWKAYVGSKPTEPKFDIGDQVRFSWRDDEDESHSVNSRDWREFNCRWYYKVQGKWWAEEDLVAAESPHLLPEGWEVEDIQALLAALEEGPVLVAGNSNLDIPTIHDADFRGNGVGHVRHLGFGLFEVKTDDYTLRFDAGGAMQRTPSGRSWTRLRVVEGEYDYPCEDVRAKLEQYLGSEAGDAENFEEEAEAETKVEGRYVRGDKVWWEDKDGNIQSGIVDYVDRDEGKETITVKYDTMMTYAGGVPIGRIERFAADDLNFGLVPEERLDVIFGLEIGEAVWWDREEAVILATVEAFRYLGDKPSVILRRKGGVVNREGSDVSFAGAFDFGLATYRRLDVKKTSPPDDTVVIEAGDSVVIAQNRVIPACNVFSPKGYRCRSSRQVAADDVFELVRFAKSTGMATHGMTCAVIRDKDGYEFHVPIEWLALRPEPEQLLSKETEETDEQTPHGDADEVDAEADVEVKVDATEDVSEPPDANEIALPFQPVELPEPILDLDEGVTIRQMMALIEESYVYSEKSEGVAANQGKRYIRFIVDAAVIDSAVKFEGQLYDSATSKGPQRYDDRLDKLVEWDVRPFARLPAQKVQNLLDEANAAREQYPELSTKADQMYRQVMTAYDLAAYYEQERLLRVWLSLFDLLKSRIDGGEFQPRIVGRHIEEALRVAFGEVSRWEDILDSSDGATDDVDEITAEANESDAEADDANAEAKLRKKRNLPNDIPLFIKIDLGRTHGWAEAEVTRVKGRWLYYALRNGNEKRGKGKVQVIGRDIIWQPSSAPADEATAIAGGVQ